MKAIFILLIAGTLTLSRGTALAQPQDGNFYLQSCGAAVKQADGLEISTQDSAAALVCAGYVTGFLDAHALATHRSTNKAFCTPERGITGDQGIRVFVKYLRENPQRLHESGRILLYTALVKAFPCNR